MTSDELILRVLPFIVLVALSAGFVVVFRQRAAARRAADPRLLVEPGLAAPPRDRHPTRRPWWGSPWPWVALVLLFVVLGVFVWPGLFGGTILVLPFLWISQAKPPSVDPRSNGHGG